MNEINGPSGAGPREVAETGKQESARTTPAPAGGGRSGSAAGQADQLSLTVEAGQLKALERHIAELPVVDTQRVEQIQRAIAAGNYEVQPARVADKMLAFESGLPDQSER